MKKILIIEDEQNIRETLADLLLILGYEVLEAPDGKTGVDKAASEHADFILCDINMPEMDGYEVLTELKKMDRLSFVPFIFLTAKSSMEELRTGMNLGADDYLTKPFSKDSLVKAIKAAEEKKLSMINHFNEVQNQLNLEKLRIEGVNKINSHEIRRKLSLIQSLISLIRSGDISLNDGLAILEESGEDMDRSIRELNGLLNGSGIEAGDKKLQAGKIKSIWLIDDDRIQNLLTKTLLHKANSGWKIQDYSNPKKALEEIQNDPPDLIFLDINMPEMDGFEFLQKISAMDLKLQVIMLSSSISPVDIQKSMGYSYVANYLVKPLKKEKVLEILT